MPVTVVSPADVRKVRRTARLVCADPRPRNPAALAHETRDVVFAAAQLVSALQSITARETSPRDFLMLGVASIAGGEAANVVANDVTLRGTVRWLDTTMRERALARMDEIAAGVCGALRVVYRLDVTATIPVMRCAPEPIATLASAASTAGANVIDPGIVPVSEDFANIAEHLPRSAHRHRRGRRALRRAPRAGLRHRRASDRHDHRGSHSRSTCPATPQLSNAPVARTT
jgi:metal-dependent amidase/aminoacylase/carboxypeptidase family protein